MATPMVQVMPRTCHLSEPLPSRQHLVRAVTPPLTTGGRRELTRFGIVHMTAGGSADGAIAWLRKIGLSYHYIIERDGTIYRCCDPGAIAFHAGKSAWQGHTNLNRVSLGVALAHWNDAREPVTVDAYQSLVWLAAVRSEADGRAATDWLGHRDVSPGRKTDPTPEVFDMALFQADLFSELVKRKRAGRMSS